MLNECFSPLALAASYIKPEILGASCRVLLEDEVAITSVSIWTYLKVFILTCFLEAPIYWSSLRRLKLSISKSIFAVVLLNLATHPIVSWIFPWVLSRSFFLNRDCLLFSEIFAIMIEAILLIGIYKMSSPSAFFISLLANLSSWWIGLYLFAMFGL